MHTRTFLLALICLSLILPVHRTDAQSIWQPIAGPYGGIILCYAVDGNDVYAGTKDGGVFRSSDNGATWMSASSGINGTSISALLVTNSAVYAATGGSMYRSSDKGTTWANADAGISREINALAQIGTTLYAGSNGAGVFMSTNEGASWTGIGPTGAGIYAICLAVIGTDLYVGTTNYVYKTSNNGGAWVSCSSGIPAGGYAIYGFAVIGSTLFTIPIVNSSYYGVYASTNGGLQWTSANSNLPKYVDVETIHANGSTLYAGTRSGVYSTTNNGVSWSAINAGIDKVMVLAVAVSGNSLLAGSGRGVHRSTDNGATWSDSMTGMTSATINTLVYDGTTLYAGTYWGKIWSSTDEGASWSLIRMPVDCVISSIFFNGTTMFAGTNYGLYRSADRGGHWVKSDTGMIAGITDSDVRSMAKLGTNLFAASYGDGIFISANNGSTWAARNNGLAELYVQSLVVQGTTLFVATRFEGVHVSTDNGTTWKQSNAGLSSKSTHDIMALGSTVFVGTNFGVNQTTNAGVSWISAPTPPMQYQTVLAITGRDSILFGAADRILLSTDLGVTWAYSDSGMPMFQSWLGDVCATVQTMVTTDAHVFAGTVGYSVWRKSLHPAPAGPLAPLLVSPAEAAADMPINPVLIWHVSQEATGYQLQLSTTRTFASMAIDSSGVSDTTLAVKGLLNATTYYWRVRAAKGGTNSPWSEVRSFITLPAAPLAPSLVAPVNNAVNIAVDTLLQWNPSAGAVSYRLQVSSSAVFSPVRFDTTITATSFVVRGLANNTQYYWRVSAINTGGASVWSAAWSFTTRLALPYAPILQSPANNAAGMATTVNAMWNAVPAATSYRLQVSVDPNVLPPLVFDQANIARTSQAVSGLQENMKYYWRVDASNTAGTGPWSNVWNFTTAKQTLAAPMLVSPADGVSAIPSDTTFAWNTVAGASSYRLQISTDVAFATTFLDQSGITAVTQRVTGMAINTGYYWRVNATDGAATGPWSTVWSFTTALPLPSTPTLIWPNNNALYIPRYPQMIWNISANATSYRLQVARDSSFSPTVFDQSGIPDTLQRGGNLEDVTKYLWRVNAANTTGVSPWSSIWTFYTMQSDAIERMQDAAPPSMVLQQNTPNPFTGSTTIQFSIPNPAGIEITVFDMLGRRIRTLARQQAQAGVYTVMWNGDDDSGAPLTNGLYVYLLRAGTSIMTRKALLLR